MSSLPYITSPGNIEKALNAIKTAITPERVSQDFVKTILKIPGGSGDQMTSFLRKIGFATNDGKPTELYTRFRNPSTSKQALGEAIKHAYEPLYVRNEFMHKLSDNALLELIVEETGQPHDSNPVKLAHSSLKTLIKNADFDAQLEIINNNTQENAKIESQTISNKISEVPSRPANVGLNLGYTINLNLPATSDQAVFNAIFKSLKENLLSNDDA